MEEGKRERRAHVMVVTSSRHKKTAHHLSPIKQLNLNFNKKNLDQVKARFLYLCHSSNNNSNHYLVPINANIKNESTTSGDNFTLLPSMKYNKQPNQHHKQQYNKSKTNPLLQPLESNQFMRTDIKKRKRRSCCIIRPRQQDNKKQSISRHIISILTLILLVLNQDVILPASSQSNNNNSDGTASSSSASSSTLNSNFNDESGGSASSSGTCFGGLQTFEKISMSSFENPSPASGSSGSGSNGSGSFGSGILIQQDDQALTSECVNLCRSQSNCLSFVIDYNKFECKSYATTQQELQQEFDAKYQAIRSINNSTTTASNNDSTSTLLDGSYGQASTVNFQHLLPSASSNYFEKICLDGVANRNQFSDVCGLGRLWTIERVVDSFLDGYVEKEVTNVNNKDECSKLCIFETQFVCRSADYDQQARLCRLSKEDRRTQPQAMRHLAGSNRQYIENQCATPGPSSCVYETKKNLGIRSMDALKFAQTVHDCQMKCNQESTFNCRSYSFHQQRCFLSGDDSSSLNGNLIKLPIKQGWQFGEKKCLVELCTKGLFSYEKITGYTLRSALSTPIDLMMAGSSPTTTNLAADGSSLNMMMMMGSNLHELDRMLQEASQEKLRHLLPSVFYNQGKNNQTVASRNTSDIVSAMMMAAANNDQIINQHPSPSDLIESASSSTKHYHNNMRRSTSNNNLAITNHCRHSCDLGYLNCPAFTIDYKNNRCQRLDRNSQGRHNELVARDGFSYYEKICLRVPEIMTMCQDKYWIYERVIGYELAPRFYDKSLKFVQSRRDCEEYCLEEKQFQCRSALYNDETSDCKLSRYDRRLATQEGGYYRNFNARISYLENQCIRDHQVSSSSSSSSSSSLGPATQPQQQLQCYYEQARDEPSYPTFTEHIEMVPAANSFTGVGEKESSSAGFVATNKTEPAKYGASYCEQICNDNSKFECHSFGYYSSTAQCFLSGDDFVSAGESATTLSTGFTYFEKRCRFGTPNNGTNNNSPDNNNSTEPTTTQNNNNNSNNPYFQPANNANPEISYENNNNYRPFEQQPPAIKPKPTSNNDPMSNETTLGNPNQYKCGLGHTFVYQRISGFEPIGGYLTLLVKDNDSPGIVSECADLCKRAYECRASVVDYNNNQCYAMLENSSIGMLSLRQTLGKDYFEGFCVADYILLSSGTSINCRNKTWIMDKIVDQAVLGVQAQKILMDLDRVQCRQACLEERLFWCKSAMFDSTSGDCKLYSIDRESMPQMRLLFTKGVDFFENQCQIVTNSCPYDAIERDMTIVSTTKSTQARSTFDCEFACNNELTFNCRSYTYLEQYPSLPNLCLLSSDSRSTSQKGSVRERSKTLYAERNCYYRRPRYPLSPISSSVNPPPLPTTTSMGTGSAIEVDPYNKQLTTMGSFNAHRSHQHPGHSSFMEGYGAGPSSVAAGPPHAQPTMGQQATASFQPGRNIIGSGPSVLEPAMMIQPTLGASDDNNNLPLGQNPCEPHQYTFERTFGYDYRLGQKERAPIAPTIGIAIACQQECLRRSDRCQSFVVDYGLPYQACFLIDSQVGANKKLLVKSPNSAYFEKVCLPRVGIESSPPSPINNELQLAAYSTTTNNSPSPMMDLQSMDISPSYSSEPWSPQLHNNNSPALSSSPMNAGSGSQLPYYLQQQQLVKNYPSRSCAKLWSFERFINHNFTIQSEKALDNVLTRAHCETLCLNEASFNCRSATYDYTLKVCRLFKNTRRTIMSQFVDLNSPPPPATASNTVQQQPTSGGASMPPSSLATSAGTAEVISSNSDSIQTGASSNNNQIVNDNENLSRRQHLARQVSSSTPPASAPPTTTTAVSEASKNIDYLENTCILEPSSCQYRQLYDLLNPYIDKIQHAVSLSDCQRQCDSERLFTCKSINYEPSSRNCMLINEDLISLNRGQQHTAALIPKKNLIYSEKSNCEMISVQCNSQEMLVTINFDSPFRGRIMAKGNPEQCYLIGDGQNNLQFPIVFGPKCNSRQEGHNTFVNEVVIQQHPVIMTDSDKTVRVMCAFEAPDQTITLKNPNSRDNKTAGMIDVGTQEASRTRHDKQQFFNSVVSNKAAPPSVLLRILDQNGRDAQMINLGDDLTLKIQMQMEGQQNSALGIFARNLAAKSSNGESLLLIDNDGCPVDHQVFPGLEIDSKDGKSLYSNFKAFRFPSSGLVNFEVQIRFCPERCQPVDCSHKGGQNNKMRSFGKRKKRQAQPVENNNSFHRTSILESIDKGRGQVVRNQNNPFRQQPYHNNNNNHPLDSLSTIMKPGKGFDYVRELILGHSSQPASAPTTASDESLTKENSNTDNVREVDGDSMIKTPSPKEDDFRITTPTPAAKSHLSDTTQPSNNQKDNSEPEPESTLTTTPVNEIPTVTEINQDFDSSAGSNLDNNSGQQQQQPETSSSSAESTSDQDQQQQPETNGNNLQQTQAQNSLMVDLLQSPPILMHVSEKVLNNYANYLKNGGGFNNAQHTGASAAPPYGGGFPLLATNIDSNQLAQRRQVGVMQTTATTTTTKQPQLSVAPNDTTWKTTISGNDINININNNNNLATSSGDESNQGQPEVVEPEAGQQNQQAISNNESTDKVVEENNPFNNTQGTASSKDLPLRFSILVGESQKDPSPATISGSESGLSSSLGWQPNSPVSRQTKPSSVSSTKVDGMDHIVVPGRDGQFEEASSSIDPFRQQNNNDNNNNNNNAIDISQQATSNGPLQQHPSTMTDRHKTRNALYEQTFDALPSNSIEAEVKMNHNKNQLNPHQQEANSESAASHRDGCNGELAAASSNGSNRLWTFIWTGTFVVALNICLVILSLVLYFKKVHFKTYNHNMMRPSSGVPGALNHVDDNLTSLKRARGSRWPSVLLKSKNNLGSTSLNTHEHFFCKLNSKPNSNNNNAFSSSSSSSTNSITTTGAILEGPNVGGGGGGGGGVGDLNFNWPNLSSSSSHSTISSMASPLTTTSTTSIVRINNNQSRHPLYKQTFSDSSSIRNGNFNTSIYKLDGKSNHILDYENVNHSHDASYVNNIDVISHQDTFDSMR